ncbi:MAG: response regulator transcription factor [Desulfobacterales bacterium]
MPFYRVIIADDHLLFCGGLRRILEAIPGVEVVGVVHDGLALLNALKKTTPDLVIVDISMPNIRGIEATNEIKSSHPAVQVLVLTMHNDKEFLYKAFMAGADGFLIKQDADTVLAAAIDALKKGKTFISPQFAAELSGDLRHFYHGDRPFGKDVLTMREKQIVKLISEGKTNIEISRMLYISRRTVENHRANLMRKLDFKHSADLVKYAVRKGYTSVTASGV